MKARKQMDYGIKTHKREFLGLHFNNYGYLFFIVVMVVSGLSITWLNLFKFWEVFSPIRLLWLGVICYLFLLGIKYKHLFQAPVLLVLIWIMLHSFNLLFLDGQRPAIFSRCAQSIFIIVLLLSISNHRFVLPSFLKVVTPHWAALAGATFAILLFSGLYQEHLFLTIKTSVIGISSNFSIFCAQIIALFLAKELSSSENPSRSLFPTLLYLAIIISPFLIWQIVSGGRAGFGLTVACVAGFGFLKFRWTGLVLGVLSTLIFARLTEFAFVKYSALASDVLIMPGTPPEHFLLNQGGIFRKILFVAGMDGNPYDLAVDDKGILGKLPFLLNLPTFDEIIIRLDNFVGFRGTIFLEAINELQYETIWLGVGVNQFKVSFRDYYPHVELLRYLGELGVCGVIIAFLVYCYPFFVRAKSKLGQFGKIYMFFYLGTTLLQPSGPLTHLNSAILFWIFYGHIIFSQRTLKE